MPVFVESADGGLSQRKGMGCWPLVGIFLIVSVLIVFKGKALFFHYHRILQMTIDRLPEDFSENEKARVEEKITLFAEGVKDGRIPWRERDEVAKYFLDALNDRELERDEVENLLSMIDSTLARNAPSADPSSLHQGP